MPRPELTEHLSDTEFLNHYWLLRELKDFCKQEKISSQGSKHELTTLIAAYLKNGKRDSSTKKNAGLKTRKSSEEQPLSLQTVILAGHTCNEQVRAFFTQVIGKKFHFSVTFQQYFKQNIGKTYQDALKYYYELEKLKKDPNYKNTIDPQFKYNRFTRDFFSDPQNKGKTRQDAINAWNEVKSHSGDQSYSSYKKMLDSQA